MKPDLQKLADKIRGMELSEEERSFCTGLLLDKVGALPLRDILYQDESTGSIIMRGEEIDFRMAQELRAGANAALNNKTFAIIREQVAYEATVQATAKAVTLADLIFYRAALWWGKEVEKKLNFLAAREGTSPLSEE